MEYTPYKAEILLAILSVISERNLRERKQILAKAHSFNGMRLPILF